MPMRPTYRSLMTNQVIRTRLVAHNRIYKHRVYHPRHHRNLSMPRTWRERVLDLRHATAVTVNELSTLSGISSSQLWALEKSKPNAPYRPGLKFILAVRKLEAIFEEELVRYLKHPGHLLSLREGHIYRLEPYGGYRTARVRHFQRPCPVAFTGRTFADIRQMDDVAAIREIKVVKRHGNPNIHLLRPPAHPKPRVYSRIMEAASRGQVLGVDEIENILEDGDEAWTGRPVQERGGV